MICRRWPFDVYDSGISSITLVYGPPEKPDLLSFGFDQYGRYRWSSYPGPGHPDQMHCLDMQRVALAQIKAWKVRPKRMARRSREKRQFIGQLAAALNTLIPVADT